MTSSFRPRPFHEVIIVSLFVTILRSLTRRSFNRIQPWKYVRSVDLDFPFWSQCWSAIFEAFFVGEKVCRSRNRLSSIFRTPPTDFLRCSNYIFMKPFSRCRWILFEFFQFTVTPLTDVHPRQRTIIIEREKFSGVKLIVHWQSVLSVDLQLWNLHLTATYQRRNWRTRFHNFKWIIYSHDNDDCNRPRE